MRTVTAWPCMAWTTDIRTHPGLGMAHAAWPGESTALCGVYAPFHCDRWPGPHEAWSAPYSRCPSCARRMYSSRRP
jgi:hypothetical protein